MAWSKFWKILTQGSFFIYLLLATTCLVIKVNEMVPTFILFDNKWLDNSFARWSGYLLTVLPGLIGIFALIPTVVLWFIAFNGGQLWFCFYYLFNNNSGFLFTATQAWSSNDQNEFLYKKKKTQLLDSCLYDLNGFFQELGLTSSAKRVITEPSQFNFRATKKKAGNFSTRILHKFKVDKVIKILPKNSNLDIGQDLFTSASKVISAWSPFINNKLNGATAYAIQLAIIAEYLNIVVSEDDQAESIWEAVHGLYNPKPSQNADAITNSDLPKICQLLSFYFRDAQVASDFLIEVSLLRSPDLSNQIFEKFKTFIQK